MRWLVALAILAACGDSVGTDHPASVVVSPSNLALGMVEIGTAPIHTLTVSNTGDSTARISPSIASGPWSLVGGTCEDTLAPQQTCELRVRFAPTELGDAGAQFQVAGRMVTLRASGASRVTVVRSGPGVGSLDSTPEGIHCGTQCSALFTGPVSLSAVPALDSTVVGWSSPECQNSSAYCDLPADTVPRTVTVEFALRNPSLHFHRSSIDLGKVTEATTYLAQLDNDTNVDLPISLRMYGDQVFSIGPTGCGSVLAAGSHCYVVVRLAPQEIRSYAASLAAISTGSAVTLDLSATGAYRLVVTPTGSATGTIMASQPGLKCSPICTGVFTTDVTLTASAIDPAFFAGWIGRLDCRGADACTIWYHPFGYEPDVSAAFEANATTIDATFTGNSTGDVLFEDIDLGTVMRPCSSSCARTVASGHHIRVAATTGDTFSGITGACAATAPSYECTFVAGDNGVTATFDLDPKEPWSSVIPDYPLTLAFDSAGAIVYAGNGAIGKVDDAGALVWRMDHPGDSIAIGPSDAIYVLTSSLLYKLDTSGNQVWVVPTDAYTSNGGAVAVGPSGEAIVRGSAGLGVWDANGTPLWSIPIVVSEGGFAVDPAGLIYVGTPSTDFSGYGAKRYQLDGTALSGTIDLAPSLGWGQGVAVDVTGHLVSNVWAGDFTRLERVSSTGTVDWARQVAAINTFTGSAVACGANGELVWARSDAPGADGRTVTIERIPLTGDGTASWTLVRPAQATTVLGYEGDGVIAVAMNGSGRIAALVSYFGVSFTAVQQIQVFDP